MSGDMSLVRGFEWWSDDKSHDCEQILAHVSERR